MTGLSGERSGDGRLTFAVRLERLVRAGGNPSIGVAAAEVRRPWKRLIAASNPWLLRMGVKDDPTKRHLEGLAGFSGVPPAYFLGQALAERDEAGPELLATLRDPQVRPLARWAAGLSPLARQALGGLAERPGEIEGQAPAGGDGGPVARAVACGC